jgi:hypothetical protein
MELQCWQRNEQALGPNVMSRLVFFCGIRSCVIVLILFLGVCVFFVGCLLSLSLSSSLALSCATTVAICLQRGDSHALFDYKMSQ